MNNHKLFGQNLGQYIQMFFNWLTLYIQTLVLVLLLPPGLAAAEHAPGKPTSYIWHESVVVDPVFHGKTFIMAGGKSGGPAMVLIHGVGDEAARIWVPFLQEYGAEYHLLTFDLPGFGHSDKQNLLYSPAAYSAFVEWVVNEYAQGGPVVVLGHSMGGALALQFAASYPDLVDRLILVDAAGVLHRAAFSKNFFQLEPPKSWPGILAWPLKKPFDMINQLTGSTVEKAERQQTDQDIDSILNNRLMRKIFLGGNPETIASLAAIHQDFSPLLGKVRAPTYIIWGADDEVAPLRTGKALAARLSGSRLEIIEGAGHTPMLEQQRSFHLALRQALAFAPVVEPEEPPAPAHSTGKCTNRSGMIFSGSYKRIEIKGCTDVLLQDVSAEHVHIEGSRVVMENSRINGRDIGLYADHSIIVATGLTVEADIAVQTSGSRLDLAAVDLQGDKAAIIAKTPSFLLFSVSRLSSPVFTGDMHGIRQLTAEESM